SVQVVPPLKPREKWRTLPQALEDGDNSPALEGVRKILRDYSAGDPKAFNQSVVEYRRMLDAQVPEFTPNTRFQPFFIHLQPFPQCISLYVLMFLLACVSWVAWDKPLGRSAFWLGVLTLVLHTWALGARMYMQDRIPPVTNLYSSAIFVGWVCIALGLALECVFPYGIASAASAVVGFGSALFAHHLAESGDTM